MDIFEKVKAQCLAHYICNMAELLEIKEGSYEERCNLAFDDYRGNCKIFFDKMCENIYDYSTLNEHEKEMLIDDLTSQLDEAIDRISVLYCELGIKAGFHLALELGLKKLIK